MAISILDAMQTNAKPVTTASGLADRLVRLRVPISTTLFVALIVEDIVFWTPPLHSWASFGFGTAGALIVVVGLAIRTWAAGVLPKGKDLATTGPYSLCRHPLYLGSFAMMVGFCMIMGDLHNYAVMFGPIVGIYYLTMRAEERRLRAAYGARWDDYAVRVPIFVPWKLSGYRSANWTSAQWRKSHEYRAVGAALAGLIALETWYRMSR